jgi:branched-chain amino acid transport system permease protein
MAFVEFGLNGIFLGAVFGLLALAIAVVWMTTDVVDIATGSYAAAAGMVAVLAGPPWGALLGILAATALSGTMGVIFLIFRRLGATRDTILIVLCTIAYSFVIESALQSMFGTDNRFFPSVPGALDVAGVFLTLQGVFAVLVAVVLFTGLLATLRWSPAGLLMRASAISAKSASLTGIPVRRVQFVVFLLGGAIAGVAGVLASMSIGVSYSSGFALSIIAFSGAVVLGRVTVSLAFTGGLLIGLAIALGQAYLPQGWDAATAPILIVAVLCSGLVSRDIFHGARP